MLYDSLYPSQKQMVETIRRSWAVENKPYFLVAGQHSGKSLIAYSFAEYHPVLFVGLRSFNASYPRTLENFPVKHSSHTICRPFEENLEKLLSRALDLAAAYSDLVIILDEPMLWPQLPLEGRPKLKIVKAFFHWANQILHISTNRILAIGSPSNPWFRKQHLPDVFTDHAIGWNWDVKATWELNASYNPIHLKPMVQDPYAFTRDFACGKKFQLEPSKNHVCTAASMY